MDKNIIKIICLIVCLMLIISGILFVTLEGIHLEKFNVVSVSEITSKTEGIMSSNIDLEKAQKQYELNINSLDVAKKEFEEQKEKYSLISDETIKVINEATKQEEYFIEYLWITLGNYATKHNLSLAVIEPGGTVEAKTETTTTDNDKTSVSTGTGTTGNANGVQQTTNSATTGLPSSGTQQPTDSANKSDTSSSLLVPSSSDLTVQVKGSYIDVADFVFEVENDKSLRFRLDNIKMKSAGGIEVLTSFNVKDFTVLKSLK